MGEAGGKNSQVKICDQHCLLFSKISIKDIVIKQFLKVMDINITDRCFQN